jgi:DNA-binding SARP family transcriptional activator
MHTLVRRHNTALSRNRRSGLTMKSMDPPVLRISLLGGFEMRCGAESVVVRSTRIRSLLAWLALRCDEPQPRLRVAAALWPESAEGQARTNLRNLIHQLRRAFPEIQRYLDCDGAALAWRHGSPVAVDVRELERALSSASAGETSSERAMEDALALYRGPLLPDHYEPWLTIERDRIRRLFLDGLDSVLRQRIRTNDHKGSRMIADHILIQDPLGEQAHRAKISALAALGDRAGALRAFNECRSVLESELGVEPSEATLAAWRAAVSDPTDAAAVSDRDLPVPPGADAAEPLVGRHCELSYLRSAHARAIASNTTAVLVVGDAGIGKSRLVQAFADGLEREGGRVVRVRAYRTTGALAYGPVIAAAANGESAVGGLTSESTA